jgi:hypothetical protein
MKTIEDFKKFADFYIEIMKSQGSYEPFIEAYRNNFRSKNHVELKYNSQYHKDYLNLIRAIMLFLQEGELGQNLKALNKLYCIDENTDDFRLILNKIIYNGI